MDNYTDPRLNALEEEILSQSHGDRTIADAASHLDESDFVIAHLDAGTSISSIARQFIGVLRRGWTD